MNPPRVLSLHAAVRLFTATSFCVVPDAWSEFYKYKDNSGAVVITNKLEDVPQKYRQRVKVVWDADLEAKDPFARRRAEAEKLRDQRELQMEQRKPVENKKGSDGKTLVISIDEETGQVIRRFE